MENSQVLMLQCGRSQWPSGLETRTVFGCSNTGIAGSNPTLGYVSAFFGVVLSCV
jgi:hypothetical protein